MGVDAAGFNDSNLHSFNRYAYGNNNPYRYQDPDGNSPIDIAFLAVDLVNLGVAVYQGEGIAAAAVNVGLSVVGVISPVPGVGQVLKVARTVEHAAEAARVADKVGEAAKGAEEGIVYLRTNPTTGEKYVGRSKSTERFEERQAEHDAAHGVKHDYDVLGNAKPGKDLSILEETMIRQQGGIQKEGGTLANKRHEMSEENFRNAGGTSN